MNTMILRGSIIFWFFLLFRCEHTTALTTLNFTIKTRWNSTPIADDQFIQFSLSSTNDNNNLLIEIDAPFYDDPAPPSSPGSFVDLWKYEVVELFFLASSTTRYTELEFSPHGHYWVLLLTNRSEIFKRSLPLPNYQVTHPSPDRWTGRAYVPRAYFPAHVDRFNAYGIHGVGERENRIWEALYPAPPESGQVDFHRLELFQPLNFTSLLNVGENDGDYWNNHASLSASFSSFLSVCVALAISYYARIFCF